MKNTKKWVIIICVILVAMMIIGPVASVIASLLG